VLLCGCGAHLYPLPDNPLDDPTTLLDKARAKTDGLLTLSAEARIRGRSKMGRAMGKVSILANRSTEQLRVDAWTPTDDLVLSLVADKDGFHYFTRGEPICLIGPVCPSNIRALLPLGLDIKSIIGALFAVPPDIDLEGTWSMAFDRKIGAYLLEQAPKHGTLVRMWIREDGQVVGAERTMDGKLDYRIKFQFSKGKSIPGALEFQSDIDSTNATVKIQSFELNQQFGDEDWEPPCNTNFRWLECLEDE